MKQPSGVEEKNLIGVFELICCVIVYFLFFIPFVQPSFLFHICTILNHRLRVIPFLEVLEAIDNKFREQKLIFIINQKEEMKCLYIHLKVLILYFFLSFLSFLPF